MVEFVGSQWVGCKLPFAALVAASHSCVRLLASFGLLEIHSIVVIVIATRAVGANTKLHEVGNTHTLKLSRF